jgi:hypothetical protein
VPRASAPPDSGSEALSVASSPVERTVGKVRANRTRLEALRLVVTPSGRRSEHVGAGQFIGRHGVLLI